MKSVVAVIVHQEGSAEREGGEVVGWLVEVTPPGRKSGPPPLEPGSCTGTEKSSNWVSAVEMVGEIAEDSIQREKRTGQNEEIICEHQSEAGGGGELIIRVLIAGRGEVGVVTWRRRVDPRFPVLLRGISAERKRKCHDKREKKEEGEESAWLSVCFAIRQDTQISRKGEEERRGDGGKFQAEEECSVDLWGCRPTTS